MLLYFSGFVVSQDLVKLLLNVFLFIFIYSHFVYQLYRLIYEPRHEKTSFLHMLSSKVNFQLSNTLWD